MVRPAPLGLLPSDAHDNTPRWKMTIWRASIAQVGLGLGLFIQTHSQSMTSTRINCKKSSHETNIVRKIDQKFKKCTKNINPNEMHIKI
jgi:hypothetical protein